ncbi:MAG: PIN domain-containing protein [Myxococcota bacterium]
MLVAPFKVVLDANVLFPFSLRDTLLRAAAAGLFQLYWFEDILDETTRNLVGTGTISDEQAARLRAAMTRAFPESMVIGYESLVDVMPNESKDRHVAAAAVKAGAQVIVTNNLKDFRTLPDGIEAQSADEFLCNLFDLVPGARAGGGAPEPASVIRRAAWGARETVPEFARGVAHHAGTTLP